MEEEEIDIKIVLPNSEIKLKFTGVEIMLVTKA